MNLSVEPYPARSGRAAPPLVLVAALNLAAMVAGVTLWHLDGVFVGFALTAWLLGVRHAFDVDHIAAIDNATRQLRQQRRSAVWTGPLFSLGHSTVVIVVTLIVAGAASHFRGSLPSLEHWGAPLGATLSAALLTLIGVSSLVLLRRGRAAGRRLPGGVRLKWQPSWRPWQIYGVGLLFGLGFDTASEIALLVISIAAVQATTLSLWEVLALPGLFAAGMTLMDTIEGLLMLRAYEWARHDRDRTLRLNTRITAASATLALGVAAWEWWALLAPAVIHAGGSDMGVPAPAMLGAAATFGMLLLWGLAVWHRRGATPLQRSG
ncbi:MAG TPA: hypothetical protein VFA95_11130 [Gammaproteobacteria bacterium]|nr:hypothetical protein [Gammaproteobacteria bacterium]